MAACIELCNIDPETAYPCEEDFRGPAVIFHDELHSNEATKLSENLSSINFKCSLELRNADPSDKELRNVACNWQLVNCTCIFLAFLLPEERHSSMERAVMNHFNNKDCKGMIAKPKIILFADTKKDERRNMPQTSTLDSSYEKMKNATTSYADIIIIRGYSTEFLDQCSIALKSTLSRNIKSLIRYAIRNSTSSCKLSYFDSTLRRRLDLSQEKMQLTTRVSTNVYHYQIQENAMNYISRDQEILKVEEHLQGFSTDKMDVLIYGPSGVGKTEVIFRIAARNTLRYNNIILFNCSNKQILQNNITEVANHLKLKTDCKPHDIMQSIYHSFPIHEKTLIIFDNLENSEEWFDSFFPFKRVEHTQIVGVSTHNNLYFPSRHTFKIEEMSEQESIMFVSKMLKGIKIPDNIFKKLIAAVGLLPRNLAVAYDFIKTALNDGLEEEEKVFQIFFENCENIIASSTLDNESSLHVVMKTFFDSIQNSGRKELLKYLLMFLPLLRENMFDLRREIQYLHKMKNIIFPLINSLKKYSILKAHDSKFTLNNLIQLRGLSVCLIHDMLIKMIQQFRKSTNIATFDTYLNELVSSNFTLREFSELCLNIKWNVIKEDVLLFYELMDTVDMDSLIPNAHVDFIHAAMSSGNFFETMMIKYVDIGTLVCTTLAFCIKLLNEDKNDPVKWYKMQFTQSDILRILIKLCERYCPDEFLPNFQNAVKVKFDGAISFFAPILDFIISTIQTNISHVEDEDELD